MATSLAGTLIRRAHFALLIALPLALPLAAQQKSTITIYRNEADFRSAVSNPAADVYTDMLSERFLKQPLPRAIGLYRYRLSGKPFGLYSSGSESEAWISTMEPPESVIVIDDFRPSVRGVGGYVLGTHDTHQMAGLSVKVTYATAEGKTTQTLNDTFGQTFFGVVSSGAPILSLRIESVQHGKQEIYPAVRSVLLGGALMSNGAR